MNLRVHKIEGIGPVYGARLAGASIRSVGDLLELCSTAAGRREVSFQTGIEEKLLLRWAGVADLMRIRGVGRQFAEMLEACGVDSVGRLRSCDPIELSVALRRINEQKRYSRMTPASSIVEDWIIQAKALEKKISH